MFKFLIACLIVLVVWYYILIILQLLGIIEITGMNKRPFNSKNFIPFYQFYKLFKNEN